MLSKSHPAPGNHSPERGASPWLLLALSLPVPLVAVGWLGISGFDGLYGQDSYGYFNYATGPLLDNLLALRSPPPFHWPPGYPLLVAWVALVIGRIPLAGQLVSILAGTLVPVFTGLLAQELWSDPRTRRVVPLLAATLTALVGQLWQSSVVVMADTTALAAVTLGMWSLARYGRVVRGHSARPVGWILLAAASVSYAVLARWAYTLVALPAFVYALMVLAQQPRRVAIIHGIAAATVAGLVFLPVILAAWGPETGEAAFLGNFEVASWNPANAAQHQFANSDGILEYRLANGLYYLLAPAHRYFFTPLLALLLPAGAWIVLRGRNPASMIFLLGWPASVYVFLAGFPWQNFRWTLTYLPPLAILTGIGAASGLHAVSGTRRTALTAAVALGLLAMAWGGWRLVASFVERKNADLATAYWVQDRLPAHAALFAFSLTPTIDYYTRLRPLDLYLLDPQTMASILEQKSPVYVILDVGSVEEQWRGRSPSLNYHWLLQGPGLVPLGQDRSYSLFLALPGDR